MRLTFIHPAIGRRSGANYLRTWQMEPLPVAHLAGLTADDIDVRFYDDRCEVVPYDEPTDVVALSVETYTARRSYQIASEYRRRGVPVIMGGFHASLCPEEVEAYADAVVVGEAEGVWDRLIDDVRHGTLQRRYRGSQRPDLHGVRPRRSLFHGKRYLPISLVELGRGCRYACDFCAIQSAFARTRTERDHATVVDEIRQERRQRRLFFFVDDNFTADRDRTLAFLRAIRGFDLRWVGQVSIHAAYDDELLTAMCESGCVMVLVGFESLRASNLSAMNKPFNNVSGGYAEAIRRFARHGIGLYGTFVFGYDGDDHATIEAAVDFGIRHGLVLGAFAHLTPFPGTPLFHRLLKEGRLMGERWWLDDSYDYGMVAFDPIGMTATELERCCNQARKRFYSWSSIAARLRRTGLRRDYFGLKAFIGANVLHHRDRKQRMRHPLGDPAFNGPLLKVG